MLQYAAYIRSDEACTDDFLQEGMTFEEAIALMDAVATAVEAAVRSAQ
jgi:hypothetical protein